MVEYTRSKLRDMYLKYVKRLQEEKERRIVMHVTDMTSEIINANKEGHTTLTKHIVREDKRAIQEIMRQLQEIFTDGSVDVVHKDEDDVKISQALITVSWGL